VVKDGHSSLRDRLPTYRLRGNGVDIDLKDLLPAGAADRGMVTIQFNEVDTIRVLEMNDVVPPDQYAPNKASYIMERFRGTVGGENAGFLEDLRMIGQNQVDVLKLLKEGAAAYLNGSIPRPPLYITYGTREQMNTLGSSPVTCDISRWHRVINMAGVPVIIEGPALFYYVFFNADNANDLLASFREYNISMRQAKK
jgi:hypothetical protein